MNNPFFTNIAISLSGGGYRAAAFHLGTLSFLEHILLPTDDDSSKQDSLLDRVRILSTISGGTITGMMWAYHSANGKKFIATYSKLYELLNSDELLSLAFKKLNTKEGWTNNNKPRNLINAFSDVYSQYFFDNAQFDCFLNDTGIQSVIFNATEFQNGLAFRFQNNGLFGNRKYSVPPNAIQDIKLGDIVAASSCFPLGFEPLIFPNDFVDEGNDTLIASLSNKQLDSIALMDGGIIDNQGIEGVKLASERLENQNIIIDTYIVSDVEGKSISPLKIPTLKSNSKNWFTLNQFSTVSKVIFYVSMVVFLFSLIMIDKIVNYIIIPILLVSFGIMLVSGLTNFFIKKAKKIVGNRSQELIDKDGYDFLFNLGILLHTPISVLKNLAELRISSTFTMVNDIFLKRIRRIQYQSLYNEEHWKNKTIGNFIYSLKEADNISEECKKIIKHANEMPTTLWFSDKHKKNKMLEDLIIAGQLTMCYKLMEHIKKIKSSITDENTDNNSLKFMDSIYVDLKMKFEQFQATPNWLFEIYQQEEDSDTGKRKFTEK